MAKGDRLWRHGWSGGAIFDEGGPIMALWWSGGGRYLTMGDQLWRHGWSGGGRYLTKGDQLWRCGWSGGGRYLTMGDQLWRCGWSGRTGIPTFRYTTVCYCDISLHDSLLHDTSLLISLVNSKHLSVIVYNDILAARML